jgi:predicted phosphodiesterase
MTLQEQNLTEEQYENCLSDIADKINGLNDLDWSEIITKYNLKIAPDTLRKASQTIFGGVFVKNFIDIKHQAIDANDNSSYDVQLREIRREKQKLFDERAAFNKSNRDVARLEQDLDYLEKLIKSTQYKPFDIVYHNDRDKDLIVLLSDMHIGLNVESNFGKYNSDIAKEMLGKYLGEVVDAIELYKIQNVYVILLGDFISGNIHTTVQLQNRENVIEQIQLASEMTSDFIYNIAKHCDNVIVNSVGGNHSRLGKKDDVLRDERLDNLVMWYAEAKLGNITNVHFEVEENIDPTIAKNTIRGKVYYSVHGDYDSFSESGVSKLVMMTGEIPSVVFYGHMHHNSFDDINNIKIIRSGSFAGTGDDYTVSKRISGKPSQVMCVVDNTGIRNFIPVDLKIK